MPDSSAAGNNSPTSLHALIEATAESTSALTAARTRDAIQFASVQRVRVFGERVAVAWTVAALHRTMGREAQRFGPCQGSGEAFSKAGRVAVTGLGDDPRFTPRSAATLLHDTSPCWAENELSHGLDPKRSPIPVEELLSETQG